MSTIDRRRLLLAGLGLLAATAVTASLAGPAAAVPAVRPATGARDEAVDGDAAANAAEGTDEAAGARNGGLVQPAHYYYRRRRRWWRRRRRHYYYFY